jgi:hypothetical protein
LAILYVGREMGIRIVSSEVPFRSVARRGSANALRRLSIIKPKKTCLNFTRRSALYAGPQFGEALGAKSETRNQNDESSPKPECPNENRFGFWSFGFDSSF